ncbi:MAG: hypothetical protein L3I91_00800 [Mycoplasma sp.]
MYHLKSVYGLIQLQNNQIILAVLQNENTNLQHCLYHKVINTNNLTIDQEFSVSELAKTLNNELVQVDMLMGIMVKRYIFIVDHTDLAIEQKIDELTNLLGIKKIGLQSMAKSFSYVDTNHILIDIKDDYSVINEYNDQNQLVNTKKTELGINYFKQLVNNQFKFANAFEAFKNCFINFKHLKTLDEDLSLFNYFPNQFLSLQQIKVKDFILLVQKWFKTFFNSLANELTPYANKNIYCNCENEFQAVFDVIFENHGVSVNEQNINLVKTNVFGLENEYTNTLINCLKASIIERKNANLENICSIDAFIAEEITSRNIQKNLLMKFGIISTQISAKLGQGE